MAQDLITITGIEEVQKMLAAAPKSVVARGYAKALGAGIGVIRAELDIRTPVLASDLHTVAVKGGKHPGDLKRALMTEVELDSNFRGGVAAAGYGKLGYIANMVEYGHRIVRAGFYVNSRGKRRKGTVTGNVPPHPFMRPAFDISADEAVEAFANSLATTLREGVLP